MNEAATAANELRLLRSGEWETIRRLGRRTSFIDGQILALEGSRSQDVFAIESGLVRISVTSSTGKELVMGERGAGELVGEMAPLDGAARSASMRAAGRVVAWVMTGPRFTEVLTSEPQLMLSILTQMARRLRQLGEQHGGRSEELAVRVAVRLLSLAEERGQLDLSITQQELANWVGATREATARVLMEMREDATVRTSRGKIRILDVENLRRRV